MRTLGFLCVILICHSFGNLQFVFIAEKLNTSLVSFIAMFMIIDFIAWGVNIKIRDKKNE